MSLPEAVALPDLVVVRSAATLRREHLEQDLGELIDFALEDLHAAATRRGTDPSRVSVMSVDHAVAGVGDEKGDETCVATVVLVARCPRPVPHDPKEPF